MLYSIDEAALLFIWILATIYTCYAATDYKIIEVDQAELIKNAPDFMTRPLTNHNQTIEGVRDLNSSEPFIFIVHQTERWNTNSQRLFEQEFPDSSQESQDNHDYVLKGRTLGVYFYTRTMTGIQAEEVWRKHGRYIATVYPYLRLLDKPKDTFQDPSKPETGPRSTSTRNRRQRRNLSSINRPHLLRNVTPMQKRETLFEESDLAEMRILSQAPGNPPPEHYAFDSAEGHGVHIYMLGSGAQIQHQAFENARKRQQITESIYAGPNGKSGALKDWDSDLSGTGILGKLVGSETGLSRRANVTVVVDNDKNGREGIPLILSALVQIFEAIISREMGSRGVIIIPSRIDDFNSYREKSLASHYISAWLREILFLFGSLSNNVLMCSDLPDDSKDDSWPALIDSLGVQNMVLVGGIDTNGDAISQVTQNSPWIYAPSQNISVPSTLGPIGNEYILKSDVALAVSAVAGILATYMSQYPSLSAVDAKHMLRAGAHSRNGSQNGPLVPWNLYMGFSIKSTDENVQIRSVSPSRRSKGEPKHNNIFARKESKPAPKSDGPEHDDDNKDRRDDDDIDNDGGKNGDDDDDNGDRDEVEDDEGSSDEDWDNIEDMQPSATKKPESSSSTSYGGTVLKVIAPPTLIKTKTETYCEVPTAIEIPKTTTLTITETKTVRRPATTITETEIQARPDAKTITIVETTTKTLGEEPDPTLVCHDLKDKQGGYKYVGKIHINDYIPTFCAAFDDISKVDRRQGDHTVSFLDKTISHFNLKVIWKDAYRRPTRPQCEKAFREIMDRCPEQTDIAPLKSNPMGWTAGGKWDYKDNSAFEIEVLEPRAKPQTEKWARCKYKAKDGDESKGYIYTIWGYGWGDREPIDNDENSESDVEKFAVDLDSACEGDGVNFDAKDMTGSRYKHSTGPGSVKLAGDEGFRELDKEMEFDVKFWIGPLGGIDAMDCIEDFLSQNNYVMGGKGLPEDYRFFDSGEEQVKCEKG